MLKDVFYYFGKLAIDGEFIGSAPSVIKDLLDKWAVELNKSHYNVPLWEEFALFTVPEPKYCGFYTGMFWNSGDSKSRKYPFVLYWKIESPETSNFLVARFNGASFLEIIHSQWQFLINVNLNNVKKVLSREGRIGRFTGNVLQTVDSPDPIFTLEEDHEGEHVKLFSSVKKEWLKWMDEFSIDELANDKIRLERTTAEPPWYLAFAQGTPFHKFIQKSLAK